jgi:hypothetical protein
MANQDVRQNQSGEEGFPVQLKLLLGTIVVIVLVMLAKGIGLF